MNSDVSLTKLTTQLADLSQAGNADAWPADQLRRCAEQDVFGWFVPESLGGQGWRARQRLEGYLTLASACLTTTFVLTQFAGAIQRIVAGNGAELKGRLLPDLRSGQAYGTLAISHLTTSRQHTKKPALAARPINGGYELDGYSPWVTGASHADYVVTGAVMEDGRQVLMVVPTALDEVVVDEPVPLVALGGSHTGPVRFNGVRLDEAWLLDGPVEGVMRQGAGARTGGLQTSALALGLAQAAIADLHEESTRRPDLVAAASQLQTEWASVHALMLELADNPALNRAGELRAKANSLVLRSTQAALVAAKGAGFVRSHAAGRRCCEALFFLVWSCPQPVLEDNLCELAGIT